MPRAIRTWDDYFIPGTEVLANRLGTRDASDLATREQFLSQTRILELRETPLAGGLDFDHFKAIHGYLFQDVYEWAGQERVGPTTRMTKSGPDVVNYAPGDPNAPEVAYGYYPGPAARAAAHQQFDELKRANHLVGLPREAFVSQLAEHWGEINAVHSFREGNTRTQVVFFSYLAERAGYQLHAEKLRPGEPLRDQFVWARFHNLATGRSERLAATLDTVITTAPPTGVERAARIAMMDTPTRPQVSSQDAARDSSVIRPPVTGVEYGVGR